jgi:hypothetical protein
VPYRVQSEEEKLMIGFGLRGIRPAKDDFFVRFPSVLLAINDQHARQELDVMTKHLEG